MTTRPRARRANAEGSGTLDVPTTPGTSGVDTPVATVPFAVGMTSVVLLSRLIDQRRPPLDFKIEGEKLYVDGNTARRMSLGFNGLIADWYWMRSLQYVGKKVLSLPSDVPLDDLGSLDLRLLAPLLDTATTLDPSFMQPYEYAAVVLPAVDVDASSSEVTRRLQTSPAVLVEEYGRIIGIITRHDVLDLRFQNVAR